MINTPVGTDRQGRGIWGGGGGFDGYFGTKSASCKPVSFSILFLKLIVPKRLDIVAALTYIELNFSDFTTYHIFEKIPILRGLQALKILRIIKIYSKFS